MRPLPFFSRLVLCFILFICFAAANAQDSASRYVEQGSGYYNKGYYDSAILSYTMAISFDSNNITSYNRRGMAYNSKNRFDSAIRDFSRAILLKPGDAFAYANRGYAYSKMNKPDLALPDLTKAIALDSNSSRSYGHRGYVYSQKKQYESAIRDYAKAIRLDTNYSFAYANRGYAYSQLKIPKPDSALYDLTKAIALDSTVSQAYGYRGFAYMQKNKFDLAVGDFTRAVSLDTNYSFAYTNRGRAYSKLKQYDLAIADFTRTIDLEPANPNAYESRSIVYFEKPQADSAMMDIFKAISLDPAYAGYYNTRGIFYNVMGKYDSSIRDFKTCIAKDSLYGKAYINIISPLVRFKAFDEATAYFTKYRKKKLVSFFDFEIYRTYRNFVTAVTLVSRGNTKLALEYLENATKRYELEVNEESKRAFLDILFVKGYVLEKLERYDEAKLNYDQSLVINPGQADLGEALVGLEKKITLTRSLNKKPTEIKIRTANVEKQTRGFTIVADSTILKVQLIGEAKDDSGLDSLKINGAPAFINGNTFFADLTLKLDARYLVITAFNKQHDSTSKTFDLNDWSNNKIAMPASTTEESAPGKYYAVLIAEKDYTDPTIPDLRTPIRDANNLRDILINLYTFDSTNVDTLYNRNREDIVQTIIARCKKMTEKDNLLIFYAGHGDTTVNKKGKIDGYLVPTSAKNDMTAYYITSEDIFKALLDSYAKHILVLLDACYSGTFTRTLSPDVPNDIKKQYALQSRKVMSSGNVEEVPDDSEFIYYLTEYLKKNSAEKYVSAKDLWEDVSKKIKSTLAQYAALDKGEDFGGQFIFEKRVKNK